MKKIQETAIAQTREAIEAAAERPLTSSGTGWLWGFWAGQISELKADEDLADLQGLCLEIRKARHALRDYMGESGAVAPEHMQFLFDRLAGPTRYCRITP